MATAKKAPAKQAAAPAPVTKAAPAKKATVPEKKTAVPTKKSAPAPAAPAKKAAAKAVPAPAPAKKAAASAPLVPAKKAAASAPAKKAEASKQATTAAPTKKAQVAAPAPAPAKKAEAPSKATAAPAAKPATAPVAPAKAAQAPAKSAAKKAAPAVPEKAAIKGVTKDGIAYTKDFDAKFLTAMHNLLIEEKASLTGQAVRLEDEALQLIEEQEMGDVQFDDEGGEGDTMVVERERDLALSAQARQTIADIEAALGRLLLGTFGYSVESGRPIPRERLEAIPWATVLVEEKVGGIGRR